MTVQNPTHVSPMQPRPANPSAQISATGFGSAIAGPRRPELADRALVAASREVATIQSHEATIDALIAGNRTGHLSSGDLLRLQATVYAYSERVDVATRVVDKAASGIRQLLTIQV